MRRRGAGQGAPDADGSAGPASRSLAVGGPRGGRGHGAAGVRREPGLLGVLRLQLLAAGAPSSPEALWVGGPRLGPVLINAERAWPGYICSDPLRSGSPGVLLVCRVNSSAFESHTSHAKRVVLFKLS